MAPLVALLPAGCGGVQSILDARHPGAAQIETFWWFALASTGALSAVTIMGLLHAIRRARRRDTPPPTPASQVREHAFILATGVAVPTLFLVGFMAYSIHTGGVATERPESPDLRVHVTGHQFWWEVTYPDHGVVTANEIHIPADAHVEVEVTSADVIHSFWVPQIQPGKIDMTPGRTTQSWLFADEAGTYRGQCTEFCGVQHALMSLTVVAAPEEEFAAWIQERQEPPPEPTDEVELRGRALFYQEGCASCHAVAGVSRPAFAGTPGPDLSDLAGRETLGALTVPNERETLREWVRDPHQFKPGVRMPPNPMDEEALDALVTYLETLR